MEYSNKNYIEIKKEGMEEDASVTKNEKKIIDILNSNIKALKNKLHKKKFAEKYENKIEKLTNDLINAQEELDKKKEELKPKYDTSYKDELQFIKDNIKKLSDKYEEEVQKLNEKNKNELEKLRNEIKEKDKKLLIKTNNSEIEELKKTIEEKDKEIADLKQNKNYIETFENGINLLKKELNTLQSELDKESKETETLNSLMNFFHYNGEPKKEKKEIQYNELYEYKNESDGDEKNKEENDEDYSYECINKNDLVVNIDSGTDIAKIDLTLRNNGYKKWLKDTKLETVGNYGFYISDIILNKQGPGEKNNYEIIIYNLKYYPQGEYKSYLGFYIEGNKFGEYLEIKINVN